MKVFIIGLAISIIISLETMGIHIPVSVDGQNMDLLAFILALLYAAKSWITNGTVVDVSKIIGKPGATPGS